MHEVANYKRSLAILKRRDLVQDEKKKKQSLAKRILELFFSQKGECQNELINNLKTAETMQEETFMSKSCLDRIGLLDYNMIRHEREFRRTIRGKIASIFGKIAGAVCIYKIFLVYFLLLR